MNTSEVIYLDGLRTQATHLRSSNQIVTDAPLDNQGKGEAFSPTDLMATSLLSCMMTIIGIQARNRELNIGQMSGSVLKIMVENPRRVSKIVVEVNFNGHVLNHDEQRQLEQAGRNCPVAKSLHPDIEQDIRFHFQ